MESRPPIRPKPDTSTGFRPTVELGGSQVDRALRLSWLDGSLARYDVHAAWLESLRREAYVLNAHSSTSIEGNPLSLAQAADAVALRGPAPANPDEREITQHFSYFRSLERPDLPDGPPDQEEIVATHRALLEGVLAPELLGRLRSRENARHVTFGQNEGTDPEHVGHELDALLAWFQGAGARLPAPLRIAIWFQEFQSIHPFVDGNGRVGRALTHRLLVTHGFPNSRLVAIDVPFNEDRRAYYDALDAPRRGEGYLPWIDHFLAALERAYEASAGLLERLTSLPSGFTGAQSAVISHALRTGSQELRVGSLVRALGSYHPITVSVALKSLSVEHGLVVHNGKRGKASAYVPSPRLFEMMRPRLRLGPAR